MRPQKKSKLDTKVSGGKRPMAQVFFPHNRAALSRDDVAVLEVLCLYAQSAGGGGPLSFVCVGHCDPRGTEEYNLGLGMKRAHKVKEFLDRKMRGYLYYHGTEVSEGERRATRDWATSRRVDVYVGRDQVNFGDDLIVGEVPPPLSKNFRLRVIYGAPAPSPKSPRPRKRPRVPKKLPKIPIPVGAQALLVDIENMRTGRRARFEFTGVGFDLSAPIGLNLPTKWIPFHTSKYLDLDNFDGSGRYQGASLIFGGHTVLTFYGPVEDDVTDAPVRVEWSGPDLTLGVADTVRHLRSVAADPVTVSVASVPVGDAWAASAALVTEMRAACR